MKTIAGIFFLPLFLALPASAAEVSLQVPADFNVTEVASLEKAAAFTFDFSAFGGEKSFILAQDISLPVTKKIPNPINVYRVLKVRADGTVQPLLDHTGQKITNLSYYQGVVYVVSRGQIFKIAKGKLSDVVSSLPTYGDYANGNLVFVKDKMYFSVGTATNAGIVGADNAWLSANPSVRDIPCTGVRLSGVNVETDNFLTAAKDDKALTGSFLPFNTQATAGQMAHGMNKCNGAVIQANLDGEFLRVYAYGLHNPKGLSVDDDGHLWVLDSGMEDRGARPIKNGKDALYQLTQNIWYGWPDFSAGTLVDQPAILSEFPNTPPQPKSAFEPNQIKHLIVSPKAFMETSALALVSDEKLNRLNLGSGSLQEFLTVTSGKIIQYKFGPDDKLYVLVGSTGGKSKLFAIVGPVAAAGSTIEAKSRTSKATQNWSLGLMLSAVAGFGFITVRNLKHPIKPL